MSVCLNAQPVLSSVDVHLRAMMSAPEISPISRRLASTTATSTWTGRAAGVTSRRIYGQKLHYMYVSVNSKRHPSAPQKLRAVKLSARGPGAHAQEARAGMLPYQELDRASISHCIRSGAMLAAAPTYGGVASPVPRDARRPSPRLLWGRHLQDPGANWKA